MSILPDKPSALIRVALADLKACEGDDRYMIRMNQWHWPMKGQCQVCLAGAVMAQTLGSSPYVVAAPIHYNDGDTVNKLLALDSFRTGDLRYGINRMCGPEDLKKFPVCFDEIIVEQYSDDTEAFHLKMHQFADTFEKLGL